jgi:preprotein translocase subunit YajC
VSPAGYGFSLLALWVFVGILHFRVWRLERREAKRLR